MVCGTSFRSTFSFATCSGRMGAGTVDQSRLTVPVAMASVIFPWSSFLMCSSTTAFLHELMHCSVHTVSDMGFNDVDEDEAVGCDA